MPEAPVRSGYIFAGWYTDNNTFRNMFLFGENGDKITENITLYAQWIENNPDLSSVEYALSEIVIGYSGGDNSKHVTGNLTLQDQAGDTAITWTSNNPGVISSAGTVNRPQGSDANVTLTATASKGSESRSREFLLKVIHRNTRSREEIHNNTIADIENMNVSNDELYISYNNDRTQVTNIEGKYSDIVIENADDALDAVYGVRSILGLSSPYEELECSVTTSDSYGGEYSFRQVYNGVRVYGRSVMASANASGEADFLSSSVIASDVLDAADMRVSLTEEQAEDYALEYCKDYDTEGIFVVCSDDTEEVIYSLGSYDIKPVYAYIVHVVGVCTISDDEYNIDCCLFVNALNGEIMDSTVNQSDVVVTRKDEKNNDVSFEAHLQDGEFYMFNPETRVAILTNLGFADISIGDFLPVKEKFAANLGDTQQVSAFNNMNKIMKWWKESFDRNSLDDNEMRVNVITHKHDRTSKPGWNLVVFIPQRDNAVWNFQKEMIFIYDEDKFAYSCAVGLDALAHETTHAVMQYRAGADFAKRYKNAPGAINEAYADIFGCIIEYDWKMGEALFDEPEKCLRNIAVPNDSNARKQGPDKMSSPLFVKYDNFPVNLDFLGIFTDHGGVHTNSLVVSHAAYLMHEDATPGGLSWQTLGQVWYRSMRLGNYGAETEFKDVRRAVVTAAKKMNLLPSQIAVIKNAFTQVGIEAASGTLSGKITDHASGSAVQGASVSAILNSVIPLNSGRQTTGSDGKYSLTLEYSRSKYLINVSAANYVEFFAMQAVGEDEDIQMDVALVRPGTGSGSIIIRSAVDDSVISGVTLNLRSGWNMHPENASPVRTGDITGENGQFTFENIASGYYTVEMIKDGYAVSYANITIAPGSNSTQTGYLSPTMNDSEYRVVLSWGESPSDLDSHLEGTHPNGDYAHVYYSNQSGSVNGKNIYLDIDDTTSYGPETITFEADPESSYEYYVVWFTGSGTWKDSEAVVNVYNGTRHVAAYTVPEVDNSSGHWSVFKITRGIFAPTNEIIY